MLKFAYLAVHIKDKEEIDKIAKREGRSLVNIFKRMIKKYVEEERA